MEGISLPKIPGLTGTTKQLKFRKPFMKKALTPNSVQREASNTSRSKISSRVAGLVQSGVLKQPKKIKVL